MQLPMSQMKNRISIIPPASASRIAFSVGLVKATAAILLLGCRTHLTPRFTKLRLRLVQRRHPVVCSYAERRINVKGGYRPEPRYSAGV